MSAYLYPELLSKAAYKKAINENKKIVAKENTPSGSIPITSGRVTFKGPHYPKSYRYYGVAIIRDGEVVKVI